MTLAVNFAIYVYALRPKFFLDCTLNMHDAVYNSSRSFDHCQNNAPDRMLLGQLYYNAISVFEFGLGESAKIAAHIGVPRYAGVDSDAEWVAKTRTASGMDHFRFTFADIGATGAWGMPEDALLQKIHINYQVASLAVESKAFDIYLVGGRYRVACACASLLHAMSHGGDMTKVIVGLHDSDIRPFYQRHFGKVANIVDKSKKLYVYKLKSNVTDEDIFKVWQSIVDKA